MTYNSLCNISVGATACVCNLHTEGTIRRRLLDIGLTQGTETTCLYQSPSGDPRAYLIRGAVIALRAEEAQKIEVI